MVLVEGGLFPPIFIRRSNPIENNPKSKIVS